MGDPLGKNGLDAEPDTHRTQLRDLQVEFVKLQRHPIKSAHRLMTVGAARNETARSSHGSL